MRNSKSDISGRLTCIMRSCVCFICSIALALALTPAYASEQNDGPPDSKSSEPLQYENPSDFGGPSFDDEALQSDFRNENQYPSDNEIEYVKIDGGEGQKTFSLRSLDDDSELKLKDSNEVEWIDRVDFPSEFESTCKNFYNLLVEATDNDGYKDYLIEDKYLQSTAISVSNEFYKFSYGFTALRFGSCANGKLDLFKQCIKAVIAAFDRDHPEVFWIGGDILLYSPGESNLYLLIGGFEYASPDLSGNIRHSSIGSEETIKSMITLRDARTGELLRALNEFAGASKLTDAEKVRFFNKWLTCSNGYNTEKVTPDLSDTVEDKECVYYPMAFECMSALMGNSATTGPVCEGYARAFKVLCDASRIPCVLTDGLGKSKSSDKGESHMWNYVQVNEGWFGIDVTWNDPGKDPAKVSGLENERYLLVGSNTKIGALSFIESHSVENYHFENGVHFTNGPIIQESAYSFAPTAKSFNDYDSIGYIQYDLNLLDIEHDLNFCTCTLKTSTYVYTGQPIRPSVSAVYRGGKELLPGIDFKISYMNNVQAGTGYVVITGVGSYYGQKFVPFNISQAPIRIKSLSINDAIYTGKGVTPNISIEMNSPELILGVDYIVQKNYVNNVNVGFGGVYISVSGIGNFKGTISLYANFKIYPKKASLKKLTAKKRSFVVKWNKADAKWSTGYELRYSTSSKYRSDVKVVNVKKVSTVQRTVKKLKSRKRYYVSIRAYKTINGVKYYGAWSANKSVKTK